MKSVILTISVMNVMSVMSVTNVMNVMSVTNVMNVMSVTNVTIVAQLCLETGSLAPYMARFAKKNSYSR